MMIPQKKTEKQRKKRAEAKEFKERVIDLELLGFVVNAIYLQEEISSGRRTRKDVLLSLLKLKQETLDKLEKEKVSELPDKLGQIVLAAEKSNGQGGLKIVSKAIEKVETLSSTFKIDSNDAKMLKLYEKLKTSYAFCLKAQKWILNIDEWLVKIIAKSNVEDNEKSFVQGYFSMNLSKTFNRPPDFTNDELELLKNGNLKKKLEISVLLAETGEKIGVIALNTQMDNLKKSLDSLNKLLTQETVDSLSRKLQSLVELEDVKPVSDDTLTPAFHNGILDFNLFSFVLDTYFVQNIIYKRTPSEDLKNNFSEILQMGTWFKSFGPIMISIEKLTPANPAKNLKAQLEAAKTEVDASGQFHDCMKTVGNVFRDKTVVENWKEEKKEIETIGDSFHTFANNFNSMKLIYTEFENLQKRNPVNVAPTEYYDKLMTDSDLSKVKTELGVMKTELAKVIDVKMATWAYAATKPENSLPSDDDINASLKCLQSQDMINSTKTAINSQKTFPAISELTSDSRNIVELKKAAKRVAPLLAEVNKLKTAPPSKQTNSRSKLPFDQKLVNQLGKGIHVPVGLVDSLENEKYLEMIVAHYDTLNPTQKQEFDPYWNNVKGTVTGAPKYAKTLLKDFPKVSRNNLEEYSHEFEFQMDQMGLKTFNGAECMNKLHEIGAPLNDKEAETRLRQLDLNFVNADSMMKAAAKAIGTVATYFLTVAPRSAGNSSQVVANEKKKIQEESWAWSSIFALIYVGVVIVVFTLWVMKLHRETVEENAGIRKKEVKKKRDKSIYTCSHQMECCIPELEKERKKWN